MKNILLYCKITAVVVLTTPAILSITNFQVQNHAMQNDNKTLTSTVNVNNAYLNAHLLNNSKVPSENIDSFYQSWPKNNVQNNTYSDVYPADQGFTGVPKVRFGGGMFLDTQQFQTAYAKKLHGSLFGDGNFASYNEAIPQRDTNSNDDKMAQFSPGLTNKADDLSNVGFQGNSENGHFKWNLQNAQANKTDLDNIVNGSDFNLTPNVNRYMKNGKVYTKQSLEKKTFTDIINKELYDWYWTTWAKEYDNRLTAEYNLNQAQKWQNYLIRSKLNNALKLDLSLAYNQLVGDKTVNEYDYSAVALEVISLLAFMSDQTEGLAYTAWVASDAFSYLWPNALEAEKVEKAFRNYVSPALNQTFWYNLFDKYLGTPDAKSGLINQYYNQYKELPSDIKLNNFDFYMPFKSLDFTSNMKHTTTQGPHGYDAWTYDSTSNFTQGVNLDLQLGMNFTLSRKDSDTTSLVNELRHLTSLLDIYANYKAPYTGQNNISEIRSIIKGYDAKLGKLTPDLNFKGDIKQGVTNYLEVYYQGIDQNFTLPLKTL